MPQVNPRMKTKTYLPDQFTIEYDLFGNPGVYPLNVAIVNADDNATFHVGRDEARMRDRSVSPAPFRHRFARTPSTTSGITSPSSTASRR